MKKTELKVGQSFDVVEVLDNWGFEELKGKHVIKTDRNYIKSFDRNGECYMYDSEIKKIAKLTITKIK